MRSPLKSPKRSIVVGALAVAATAGLAITAATGSATASRYRTANADYRSVAETMDEVGTIEPVSHAEVAFPAPGTVATVEVEAGDTVTAGDVLATLDTDSLEASLREAQATLDEAELTLERALAGEDVGAGGGGALGGIGATSTGDVTIQLISTAVASVTEEDLRAAQRAVLDAQRQVDADLIAADEALASAQDACSAEVEPPTTSTTGTTTPDDTEGTPTACADALATALAAQQQLSTSQKALTEASTHYDQLLAERAAELQSGTPPTTGSGGSNDPGDPDTDDPSIGGDATSGPDTSGGGASDPATGSNEPSSARLAAYQSAIDAAAIDVTVAEEALEQAAIVSPIDGEVTSVDLAPGDDVTAASDTATVGIDGAGGLEVTATISVDDLPDLGVGQRATVTPDGTDTTYTGEVVRIGLTSTSGTSGATYPLTISIDGNTDVLRTGSVASIAITLAEGDDVLSVPTSAVRGDGDGYTVTVLDSSGTSAVDVEVGAIGPTWTEIESGLTEGVVVVLADLDEPLPGSATDSGNSAGQGGTFGGRFPVPGN